MDELKEKLKGVKLKSLFSKKAPAFKGTGHVLGSGPGPSGSAGAASGRAAAPQPSLAAAQRSALPPQRQPVPPAAGAGRPVQHAPLPAAPVTTGPSPAAPSPLPPPSAAPVAAAPAAPGASSPAADEPEPVLPPSPGAQEAVEAAVAQLASDGPHAAAAAAVLSRLLRNVLASPADPKFRRLRLSNPREAVVEAAGGLELLQACGFHVVVEEPAGGAGGQAEGYAVLDPGADLRPLQCALQLLEPLSEPPAAAAAAAALQREAAPAPGGEAPGQRPPESSSVSSLSSLSSEQPTPTAMAVQQPAPAPAAVKQPQQRRERVWDPPRERATRVLLPAVPATDLPDWFFLRTGAELKAAFLAAARRREQEQVLTTRAARGRLHGPPPAAPAYALLRVRLPEGLQLQGEFNPGEAVAAVFAWVSDCLADPGCTYELVLPSRRRLEAAGQAVRDVPELLPAATLNFRWTGQSAADMQTMPALRGDLLAAAQVAEQPLQQQ